ncbi:hypothetical protein LOK49_LG15G00953 [Camellia lanceoleosa]|uniref:Uncharacterized protein n=1 Tax=Camellia lanceoleosa TaxID=1840588 RepID=A0ACC0F3Z3_9ERIC|nr:hypothetical protein LOK49_LG15G00953 [Camellia lanceoleosa]
MPLFPFLVMEQSALLELASKALTPYVLLELASKALPTGQATCSFCLILSVLPAKFNLRFPTISDKTVYTTEAALHDMNQYG